MHTTSISRSAFTNDLDHSSESSREGSVQIVESHRHTFSVPSSDEVDSEDEENEVQISSSITGDEGISAATTPDDQAVEKAYSNAEDHAKGSKPEIASAETRGFTGPSLRDLLIETKKDGTSQENPIDLEGACPNIVDVDVVDTESEDDGPDVLPLYESSKTDQSSQARALAESQVVRQTSAAITPTMTTLLDKKTDQDSELHRRSTIPETQAKEPPVNGHQPTSVLAGPTSAATDELDSEDDDGFGYDHELLTDEDVEHVPKPPAVNVEIPTSSKPKVTFQVGNANPHYTTLTPPFDEFHPVHPDHLSASDPIDVSQSAGPFSAWNQRAPSPSDAALARKVGDSKTTFNRDILNEYIDTQWPAVAKASYDLHNEFTHTQGPAVAKTPHNEFTYTQGSAAAKASHYDSTEQMFDNAALHQEIATPFVWPELQTPELRLYEQGPFSSPPKAVVADSHSPKPEFRKNQIRKTTVTWAEPHGENYDLVMNADDFSRTGKRASKITIPSLVENYLAENPRVVTRKYGGITGSSDVDSASKAPKLSSPMARTSGYKRTFLEANADPCFEEDSKIRSDGGATVSAWQSGDDIAMQRQSEHGEQETPLPDAQPREDILQASMASESQDTVPEPAVNSPAVTSPSQDNDAEGPARKKARTLSSSPSSRGVGKFVLGMGFGLLGAAAAFVATIPASVYEEALREFGNDA